VISGVRIVCTRQLSRSYPWFPDRRDVTKGKGLTTSVVRPCLSVLQ
jgi:hypothetical protein